MFKRSTVLKRLFRHLLKKLGTEAGHDLLSQAFKDLSTASVVGGAGMFYISSYGAGASLLVVAVLLFFASLYFREEK